MSLITEDVPCSDSGWWELLERVQIGEASIAPLRDEFERPVLNLYRKNLRIPEDACQEFWIRVLKAKPREEGYFRGWIWSIAFNNLLHAKMKENRAPMPVPDVEEDALDSRASLDWEPPATGALDTALSKLQSADQMVLKLRAHGCSWKEIADEFEVTPEAAAARGARALTRLKEAFFRALGKEDV